MATFPVREGTVLLGLLTGAHWDVSGQFLRVRDQIQLMFEAYAAGLKEGNALA